MATDFRVRDNIGYSRIVQKAKTLDGELRPLVVMKLDELRDSYGEKEHDHVVRNIEKKLTFTDNDSTYWVRMLSVAFRNLFVYYRENLHRVSLANDATLKTIGATLFYFIDPLGVIPDYVPESGYVDDAFAFYYCVRQLPKDWETPSSP